MTPPPDTPKDDDIDDWLDELAGRRPTADPMTQALRQAITGQDAAGPVDDQDDEAALTQARQRAADRMQQHLQSSRAAASAGDEAAAEAPPLAPTQPPAPSSSHPPGRTAANDRRWLLVASVAGLAILGSLVWQRTAEEAPDFVIAAGGAPVWRDLSALPRITAARPDQAARDLARQIAPLDTRPALYRDGATVLVDFDVQPDQMAALVAAVSDPRIKSVVKPGTNRIIFVPSP